MTATNGWVDGSLPLVIPRGVTSVFPVQITDAAGLPRDITGWDFLSQIRKTPKGPVIVTLDWSIVMAADGWVNFILSEALAATIPAGNTITDPASLYHFGGKGWEPGRTAAHKLWSIPTAIEYDVAREE